MKRRYQIDREKAVRRVQKHAEEGQVEVQLHLPLKEVAAALQEGVGRLMRQAGLELMQLVMEDEVRQLAGERCARRQDEQASSPSGDCPCWYDGYDCATSRTCTIGNPAGSRYSRCRDSGYSEMWKAGYYSRLANPRRACTY